jgi:hypothetical protein
MKISESAVLFTQIPKIEKNYQLFVYRISLFRNLRIMVVLVKMANYKFVLGSNVRFAFQIRTSTFVTSPSFVSVFSWAMDWINVTLFVFDKVYTRARLNTCERFKDNFCNKIKIFFLFQLFCLQLIMDHGYDSKLYELSNRQGCVCKLYNISLYVYYISKKFPRFSKMNKMKI